MRGGKALTIEDLEALAGVFTGGLVDITIDYDAFVYTIEFRDTYGIPERIEDVQQALARDIPATTRSSTSSSSRRTTSSRTTSMITRN